MKIALAQISPKLSKDNFDIHLEYISKAHQQNVDVLCFPELSLNGYNLQDAVKEEYFTIKELDVLLNSSIDIVLGCVLKIDSNFYNSALYISNGKIIHIHHKNILPNYGMFEEQRFFDCGFEIKSFMTQYGQTTILICEDVWNDRVYEDALNSNAKNIFILSASPTRGFEEDTLSIEQTWDTKLKNLSTNKTIIYTNRVGFEDGIGFWGGSRVYKNNKLIKKAPLFEEVCLSVDI